MAKKGSQSLTIVAGAESGTAVLFYDRQKKLGLSTIPLETASLLPRIGELVQLPSQEGAEITQENYCVVDIRYIYKRTGDAEPLECVRAGKKPPRSVHEDWSGMHLTCVRIELDRTE
jgi:hypothetical protein